MRSALSEPVCIVAGAPDGLFVLLFEQPAKTKIVTERINAFFITYLWLPTSHRASLNQLGGIWISDRGKSPTRECALKSSSRNVKRLTRSRACALAWVDMMRSGRY